MLPVLTPTIALLAMAFFTLLERKFLGYSQSRKGPNKPGFVGIPQPLADALKLFSKAFLTIKLANKLSLIAMPWTALILAMITWNLMPSMFPTMNFPFSIIFFLMLSALNVYWVMGAGWVSNSKFSLLGALRSVAQTISYEILMTATILTALFSYKAYSFSAMVSSSLFLFLLLTPLTLIWLFSCLAETNRAPFDHAESESELVSGFNTEYGGSQFAFLFMAEYMNILFLSTITPLIFINSKGLMNSYFIGVLFAIWFIWVRTTLPRIRYDVLMDLAWKTLLPISFTFFMLFILVIP